MLTDQEIKQKYAIKYVANIKWSWGLKEEKLFDSVEQRYAYLSKMEDDIDYCVLSQKKYSNKPAKKYDGIYCPMTNKSDYDLDVYF